MGGSRCLGVVFISVEIPIEEQARKATKVGINSKFKHVQTDDKGYPKQKTQRTGGSPGSLRVCAGSSVFGDAILCSAGEGWLGRG